ncbi:unnamed protein product [Meloidogyne enterolobii]|uniref:Uncharacterized protein n=1 Tax=Meloidogyne enterolobii TaxID=390850 RepID=A0ACB0Z1H7_MELEN
MSKKLIKRRKLNLGKTKNFKIILERIFCLLWTLLRQEILDGF